MNAEEAKTEASRVARAILAGEIELVPGCQAIQEPLGALGLREDEDFTIFIGVDSEADELPLGDERQHWNPEALRALDPVVAGFHSHYRPYVEEACRMVLARLG